MTDIEHYFTDIKIICSHTYSSANINKIIVNMLFKLIGLILLSIVTCSVAKQKILIKRLLPLYLPCSLPITVMVNNMIIRSNHM